MSWYLKTRSCVLVVRDYTHSNYDTYILAVRVKRVICDTAKQHSSMPLLARCVLATTNRRPSSFVLAYTERRRRYEAPDELRPLWPWCSPVGRGKARATCVCGRGAVMCSLGAPGCVTGRLFHPGDCVDQCMASDWLRIQTKSSDWLKYNQKRLKAKHNRH